MTIPLDTLRDQIAETIGANVSAQNVPTVCQSVGIQEDVQEGDSADAFRSKRAYVKRHLLKRDKTALLQISAKVLTEFASPALENTLSEMTTHAEHRVSQVTRKDVLKALDSVGHLSGEKGLITLLSTVFGKEVIEGSAFNLLLQSRTLEQEITKHYIDNPDWDNEQLLTECGALICSQTIFFKLLTELLHPMSRRGEEQEEAAKQINSALRRDGFEMCAVDSVSGYPVYGIVRLQPNVPGAMKNLIFASIGEKPELVFIDAINNDVKIVKNEDKILIFDRPLPPSGQLLWRDLVAWWQLREGLEDEKEAYKSLYQRLARSVHAANSPGEFALFRKYYERFGKQLREKLPALIPQVYLHYDPYTKRERGDEEFLARQRMDFLLMLENRVRIVIEIDGRHHYATEDPKSGQFTASPELYAKTCLEDRRLRLLGYEVYRFGGIEFIDTDLKTRTIGPQSEEKVLDFFERLLKKYEVI
jgi:AbiJ N-terminal domain 3